MGRLKIVCLPKIPSNLTYGFTGRSRTAQLPSCSKVTTLTVSGGLAVTEGENASFTLRINPAPSNPVTVNINVADADKANVDFDTSAANVDFLDSRDEGDKTVTIPVSGTLVYTVNTVDDNIDEPEGRVAVSVQNNNGYVSDVLSTAWVLVKDNDATTVTLRTPDATVIKGSTTNTARIALTLNRTLRAERVAPALTPRAQRWSRDWWVKYYYGTKWWRREELKVPLGFTGGTLGTDFTLSLDGNPAGVTLSDGVVTFPGSPKGSSRTATVVLSVPADAAIINDRIMVSIPSSTSGSPALTADVLGGGATGSLDGNGEIVVSDGVRVQEVEVNVTTAAKGVIEGGNVTFAITATPPPTAELPVSVTVTAVGDYGISAGSRTVTIPTSGGATLTLSTTDDMTDENDGSATLTLDTGASYTIGANSSQTVTIKDNNERRQSICYRTRLMDQTIITHLGLLRTPEQYCALDTHQITSLNEDAFSGLSDSLQIIDLWNNSLTSLPENVFDGFLNLNAIYLRHNLLTSLPEDVFDGLSNLVWLKLFNNRLTSLPEDTFDGLSNLTELYLQNNNLTILPKNIFDGLSDLNVLALHNNKLTILPENIFDDLSSLKSLYLHGNDLICRPRIPSGVDVGHAISQLPLCVDGPQVNITSAAGGAEGDNVTFTITATPPPTAELPVSVTVTTVGDYGISTGSQTVTIPTSGSATLTLSTTDDEVDENDGSVTVTLEAGTGYTVGTRSSETVPITDNDVTTQQQQVDSEDNGEDDNPYAAYADLIADVRAYVAETANGEEHVKRWQRVLKALGEDDAAFAGLTPMTASEAQTYADRGWSRWEPVATALTALEAAAQPPVQPTITIAGGSAVTEGGDVTFTLTANPAPAANLVVTVSVSESGNVASSGATGTRTVTIDTSGTVDFTVATEDDAIDEADGSIAATVTAGTGYTVGSVATASVAVADNDVPPEVNITSAAGGSEGDDVTFVITATPAPTAALPVSVTVTAAGDYGISTGVRTVSIPTGGSFTLTLSTTDDTVDEEDGSVTLTLGTGAGYTVGSLSSQTASITDDDVATQQQVDNEDNGEDDNPYAAYAGLIADVRVYVAETANGEEHVKRWQRVLKALGEKDAAFTGLTPMTASEAQTYADRGWSRWEPVVTALTALEAAAQPPVQPTVSIAGGSAVTEGGDVTFTLTADPAPAANLAVTVSVSESGNVASSGATGTRTVTVGTGGTVDFTVATEDDAIDEADGSIAATVTAGTGYTVGSVATASVVVRDDEVPTVSIAGGSAVTEGGDVVFTLTASPAPAANLAVTVSVSENGNFAASGQTGARTVNIGTGGTVTFTVATEDDDVDEADGSIAATVTAGTGYTVGSVATASVAVADNDVPPPEVNITSAAGGSEGADVTFVITATPAPTAALPVRVTITAVGEYGISAGARTVSIPTGGSFTLRLSTTDDTVDEEDGSVTLTLGTGAGYTVGSLSSQTASITDDDVATEQQVDEDNGEDDNPYAAYADLIADVRGYAGETESGEEHVKRWQRVLKALGESDAAFADLTPMTASEAQTYADKGWARWEPVAMALTALEAATQLPVQPTVSITGGSAVTEGGDVTFTLTATPPPAADLAVTVSMSESGSFASAGATGARTVTIGAGGTVDFTVTTEDDDVDETDGVIEAMVTAGTGYAVAAAPGNGASVAVADTVM